MRIRLTESRKKSRQLPSLYNGSHVEFATQCARHAWHTCSSANLTKNAPNTPFVLVNLLVVYANGSLFFCLVFFLFLFFHVVIQIVLHLHFCLTPLNNQVSHYFNFVRGSRLLSHLFPSSEKILSGASMLVLLQTCLTDITAVILSIFLHAMHYAVSLQGLAYARKWAMAGAHE